MMVMMMMEMIKWYMFTVALIWIIESILQHTHKEMLRYKNNITDLLKHKDNP